MTRNNMIQEGEISNGVKILAVIPARLSSTRLAGKVLAKDRCEFLVQQTCKGVGAPRQYSEFVKGYEK